MVPLQLGTGFVALGLIIALFIIFASAAAGMLSQFKGGSATGVNADRRNVLESIVGLSVAALLASIIGGTAVSELFESDDSTDGQTGGTLTVTGTYTVDDTETVSEA